MFSTRGHAYHYLGSFLDVRTPSHAAGCSGGLLSMTSACIVADFPHT